VKVKGGTLSYDATRAVWRRREAGAVEIRDSGAAGEAGPLRAAASAAPDGDGHLDVGAAVGRRDARVSPRGTRAPVLDADRLLGCWNVVLARWLRAAVRQELEAVGSPAAAEVTADPTGRVVVSHLVDLARHGDPPAPGDDEGTWYLETLPSVLTRA
jgi:hypothetical protein